MAPAMEFQLEYWKRRLTAQSQPKRNKHSDSPYLLSDLLVSRQGRKPMNGKTCGPKNHKIRYYIVREAERHALVDDPRWRRMVRAARLEQAGDELESQPVGRG